MPHAELEYSGEIPIDPLDIPLLIEAKILRHDVASGECKGRACPCTLAQHKHLLFAIMMPENPHPDAAFTSALTEGIETGVKELIPESCFFSFSLGNSTEAYVTHGHEVRS